MAAATGIVLRVDSESSVKLPCFAATHHQTTGVVIYKTFQNCQKSCPNKVCDVLHDVLAMRSRTRTVQSTYGLFVNVRQVFWPVK